MKPSVGHQVPPTTPEDTQLLAREERQLNIDRCAKLCAKATRRICRAPRAGVGAAVEHQNVANSALREVKGDARSDDPAADHRDRRAIHSLCCPRRRG
jgi:hypothetical protein